MSPVSPLSPVSPVSRVSPVSKSLSKSVPTRSPSWAERAQAPKPKPNLLGLKGPGVEAMAGAAPRLINGEAVRAFLLGRWAMSKTFDYRIGGGRGTMEGFATFTETPQRCDVLMYEERGAVQLEGLAKPVEAYRLYCFNTGRWPVEVYFVDDDAKTQRSVTKKHLPSILPELACHTSFFVPLPFGGVPSEQSGSSEACFNHLCIEDLYSGQLLVRSPDLFEWNWSVTGPHKDGGIICSYRRMAEATAPDSSGLTPPRL
ncbi:unnamed protein product [Polarella glacialis]|uniref:DUF6314 domain-containing protein n=1 Tax=Polarella glacialis TaxID=89957 RepID=A0A813JYV2_POLGL|nr:unnamed protein product [Polarella glacialis]